MVTLSKPPSGNGRVKVQRRKHAKSRSGCSNCKKRHIRCDETSPECRNCTKRMLHCSYRANALPFVANSTWQQDHITSSPSAMPESARYPDVATSDNNVSKESSSTSFVVSDFTPIPTPGYHAFCSDEGISHGMGGTSGGFVHQPSHSRQYGHPPFYWPLNVVMTPNNPFTPTQVIDGQFHSDLSHQSLLGYGQAVPGYGRSMMTSAQAWSQRSKVVWHGSQGDMVNGKALG